MIKLLVYSIVIAFILCLNFGYATESKNEPGFLPVELIAGPFDTHSREVRLNIAEKILKNIIALDKVIPDLQKNK